MLTVSGHDEAGYPVEKHPKSSMKENTCHVLSQMQVKADKEKVEGQLQ